ncbi:MAG: hypothetical protein U0840_18495 [Gemmataceae bacterium]
MIRTSLAVLFALTLVGLVQGQDPGRPIGSGPVQEAYIFNNTSEPARATIVSPRGAVTGTIQPGVYARFSFYADGRPRVLVGFSRRSGDILTNRAIELYANHAYDVQADIPIMAAPGAVGSPDGKRPAPVRSAPPVDKGKKAAPKKVQSFGEGNN